MSQDPLGLAPDANPYRYCGNGPTNWADSLGLATPEQLGIYRAGEEETSVAGKVDLGGGNVIEVHVFTDVILAPKENGKWKKTKYGQVAEFVNKLAQFQAKGPDCSKCHWLQFVKESWLDAGGKSVTGNAGAENAPGLTFKNDEWYIDSSGLYDENTKTIVKDPNAIYTDYEKGHTTYIRSKGDLSLFDGPSPGFALEVPKNVVKIQYSLKTYLVCGDKVRYRVTWSETFTRNKDGIFLSPDNGQEIDSKASGPATALDAEFNTEQWHVGESDDKKEVYVKNPFLKQQ
jgi:hypothetical protein